MSGLEYVFSVPNGSAVGIRYTATAEGAMATDYPSRALLLTEHVRREVSHIRTGGYTYAGDGGGALYKRVGSEPAHAFKIQSSDGAWWEGVPPPEGVNVKQFGAVGDGVTDDRAAIQAAIDYACQTTTGGVVNFPFGAGEVYGISTGLTLDFEQGVNTTKHIVLQGMGAPWAPTQGAVEKARIQWIGASGGGPMLTLLNPLDVVIDRIGFDGNDLAAHCIEQIGETGGYGNINWDRCAFERTTKALFKFTGSVDGGQNKIEKCIFAQRRALTGTAKDDALLLYEGANNIHDQIINCTMTYTISGAAAGYGIYRDTGACLVRVQGGFLKAATCIYDSAGAGTMTLSVTDLYCETGSSGSFYVAAKSVDTELNFTNVWHSSSTTGYFIDMVGLSNGKPLTVFGGLTRAANVLRVSGVDEMPVTVIGFSDGGGAYSFPGTVGEYSNVTHIGCSRGAASGVLGGVHTSAFGLRMSDEESDGVLNVGPTYGSVKRVAISGGTVTIAAPSPALTAADDGLEFEIHLRNTSTGTPTTSWNAIYKHAGGSAATFPSGAPGTTIVRFRYRHALSDYVEISRTEGVA